MNLNLPYQKISVARNMNKPGIPKAICGPYFSRSTGVSKVDEKAPRFIAK